MLIIDSRLLGYKLTGFKIIKYSYTTYVPSLQQKPPLVAAFNYID